MISAQLEAIVNFKGDPPKKRRVRRKKRPPYASLLPRQRQEFSNEELFAERESRYQFRLRPEIDLDVLPYKGDVSYRLGVSWDL